MLGVYFAGAGFASAVACALLVLVVAAAYYGYCMCLLGDYLMNENQSTALNSVGFTLNLLGNVMMGPLFNIITFGNCVLELVYNILTYLGGEYAKGK